MTRYRADPASLAAHPLPTAVQHAARFGDPIVNGNGPLPALALEILP